MEITNVSEVVHTLTEEGKATWGSRAVAYVLSFVKVAEEKVSDLVLSGLVFSANLYKAREKEAREKQGEIALTDYKFNEELKEITSDFIGFESEEKERLLGSINTRLKEVIKEEITKLKAEKENKV